MASWRACIKQGLQFHRINKINYPAERQTRVFSNAKEAFAWAIHGGLNVETRKLFVIRMAVGH